MNNLIKEQENELIQWLESKIEAKKNSPFFIAIDGRCASGKTTLAASLMNHFKDRVTLLHMDDYYLRMEQRTPERYAAPGENVDHERFLEQVLIPASQNQDYISQIMLCPDLILDEPKIYSPSQVMIIEGSYSFHQSLFDYYDVSLFLDIGPETQMQRIIQRNGEMKAKQFRDRWIPLEEKYIASLKPYEKADRVLISE